MFPALYHAHQGAYVEDIPFWLELASEYPNPVLEMGCGTGRVLHRLGRAGHPIYGMDNDPEMLKFCASQRGENLPRQVNLLCSDMRRFHLEASIGMAIVPCNTLSTFTPEELGDILDCVANCLVPGGGFAASLPNPHLLSGLPPIGEPEVEEVFPHPQDGEPVQVSSAWRRLEDQISLTWIYDHLLPDGEVQRVAVDAAHYLHTAEVYQGALENAGFGQVSLFGNFDRKPYRNSSPYLILVAKKN